MIVPNSMSIRITTSSAALKELAADQAGIDVDVGERLGADTLKVKVEVGAVDLAVSSPGSAQGQC